MLDESTIKFTAKALKFMTLGQVKAITEQIVADGIWEDKQYDLTIHYDSFGGTLMVSGLPIVLGIEPDGYTHS